MMNRLILLSISVSLTLPVWAQSDELTQALAENEAVMTHPWFSANRQRQAAVNARSIAAATEADPKISLGLANLPLDNFDFNQEGMTQLKVGISQQFGRGDSLALMQKQLQQQSLAYPLMRSDRQAKVRVNAGVLWLKLYQITKTAALINKDRHLFEQLIDIAEMSYSSAFRRTSQQDVIRAELELILLDDRLTVLAQRKSGLLRQLGEWLSPATMALPLGRDLPKLTLNLAASASEPRALMSHPAVKNLAQQAISMTVGIDVAKQSYEPQWGINASYGYRSDMDNNTRRADLVSVGVTFDLPLFTANRQDQYVKAAIASTEAVKIDKILLLRQMSASAKAIQAQLYQLNQRKNRYRNLLIPQVHQQAEAALNAYSNDDGDFSEVMRARIVELNTNISALNIEIEQQILITRLNYFLTGNAS